MKIDKQIPLEVAAKLPKMACIIFSGKSIRMVRGVNDDEVLVELVGQRSFTLCLSKEPLFNQLEKECKICLDYFMENMPDGSKFTNMTMGLFPP